jgi:hypothetical protein
MWLTASCVTLRVMCVRYVALSSFHCQGWASWLHRPQVMWLALCSMALHVWLEWHCLSVLSQGHAVAFIRPRSSSNTSPFLRQIPCFYTGQHGPTAGRRASFGPKQLLTRPAKVYITLSSFMLFTRKDLKNIRDSYLVCCFSTYKCHTCYWLWNPTVKCIFSRQRWCDSPWWWCG